MWRTLVTLPVLAVAVALAVGALAPPAAALELCSPEARGLMREVGISEAQIAELCRRARRAEALMALDIRRTADEFGYCRVTLALHNNTLDYLNRMTFTTADGRFDPIRFANILPGRTGYTTVKSRSLLACDELEAVRITLLWPASLRLGDEIIQGSRLRAFRPVLLHDALYWER